MSKQYLIWLLLLMVAFNALAGDEFQSGEKQNIDEGLINSSEDTIPLIISSSPDDGHKSILTDLITEIPGSIAGVITNESSGFCIPSKPSVPKRHLN